MAKCIKCGTETKLYDRGAAICTSCSDALEASRKPPVKESSAPDLRQPIGELNRDEMAGDAAKIKVRRPKSDEHKLADPHGQQRR